MRLLHLAIATALCATAQAQDSAPKSIFQLTLQGKPSGTSDYTIRPVPTGYNVLSHATVSLGSVNLELTSTQQLDKNHAPLGYDLQAAVNGAKQSVRMEPDKDRSRLNLSLGASGQSYSNTVKLKPNTVVLADFDPSGFAVLLKMHGASAETSYWAVIPKGLGMAAAATLAPAPAAKGTLLGARLALKHYRLQIASVATELWADNDGNLMEAAVPAQSIALIRTGFALAASSAPDPAADAPQTRQPPAAQSPPLPSGAIEKSVSFASDGFTIPGSLVLPSPQAKRVPMVVLVAGSGPNDRDETIGPNKPLRDIAYGLSADGIASLRYDKRTYLFAHQTISALSNKGASFGLDDEVTDDAVAALAYAYALPQADPRQIFLAGHSLGAEMAPYIAAARLKQAPGSLRGIILLAGVEETPDKVLLRQIAFQQKLHGADPEQVAAKSTQLGAQFNKAEDPATPADQTVPIAGIPIPAGYWRDWMSRDAAKEMATLGLPMLVLRGRKDIQATEADYQALAAAAKTPGSKSMAFDDLNHLFMPVPGDSTGAEYDQPGRVAPELIAVMAAWIKSL